ncbi:MAG: acetamidase/formamidase family protein [Pyramidobacter sp.]|nr:acetamidase/formamidase family protein [Pyramidobacter sp.]
MPNNVCKVGAITSVIGEKLGKEFCVSDGDVFVAETAPGCWGPMITPCVSGGHEITGPIWVNGAEPGDAVALTIQKIEVLSAAAASGTGRVNAGFFDNDPSVKAICPYCHISNPETELRGTGEASVCCKKCGKPILPQTFDNGYTVVCGNENGLAVAADEETAGRIAQDTLDGKLYLPEGAKQHLATILGRADFSWLVIRSRPMIGNIGCSPSGRIPASKNAGDYYRSLSKTDLYEPVSKDQITDAHMDIKSVGEGCIVISPVLVPGAGVYVGDVHLTQGDGEIAGHTLDISARVTVSVTLIKNMNIKGPILIPVVSELDSRFAPFSGEEYAKANELLAPYGKTLKVRSYPVQFVGSGTNMNEGLENALDRAQLVTGLSRGELMNRATVGGEIRIGRTSGLVYLTMMLEKSLLEKTGLLEFVLRQYGTV